MSKKNKTEQTQPKFNVKGTVIITAIMVLVVALSIGGTLFFVNGGFNSSNKDDDNAKLLSFAQATSLEDMEKLNGKPVSIIGYMSTLSPVSGKFMYLMNLPYQSCPFCIPNTTTLSNTLAIYAEDGKTFKFTDRAIQVTGILEFGSWTDEFGYQYDYRIKDATYTILDTDDMSEELKLWQSIAASNVISDVYGMFDYLNFICMWPEYTANFGTPDYIYASDALSIIGPDGTYNAGTKDAYYATIISKIESVDPDKFAQLEKIVTDAQALSKLAISELESGNYTIVEEYSNAFQDGRSQYKLNKSEELTKAFEDVYYEFASWLSSWEV